MSYALHPPDRTPPVWLLGLVCLILVAIGGQCRGSLAQEPTMQIKLRPHLTLECSPDIPGCPGNDTVVIAPLDDTMPTRASVAQRRKDIADCKAHGGLPVVIAGPVSSEGTIGCAAPLGQ